MPASTAAVEQIKAGTVGRPLTLVAEFREHWGGIFSAHPWLSGPSDTYLGFWRRGGGASGEHSHAMNIFQFFAHALGAGRVTEVTALLDYVERMAAPTIVCVSCTCAPRAVWQAASSRT